MREQLMKLVFATSGIQMFIIEAPYEIEFFPNPNKKII